MLPVNVPCSSRNVAMRWVPQEYEAKVAEGEDYGYDKILENILIRHVEEAVSSDEADGVAP